MLISLHLRFHDEQPEGGDLHVKSGRGPQQIQRLILGLTLRGDLGFPWLAQRSVADLRCQTL